MVEDNPIVAAKKVIMASAMPRNDLQHCRDAALDLLSRRLHSESELRKKLSRRKFEPEMIETVISELKKIKYVDDQRFATTKSLSAMQHKHHGRRRAYMELLKSGVKSEVAEQALNGVYNPADSIQIARQLAMKKAASLKRLEPLVARRRLVGMLQRRGFEYEAIKTVIDEVLGNVE